MRILILGNNYTTESFFNFFNKDKSNIVFTTHHNCNYMDFYSSEDIVDFALANDINFVLVTDEKYIDTDISELLCEKNITVFSPNMEASEITVSKAAAKKFMYKNEIPTPKFQVCDKPFLALDYIKNSQAPFAIKPDRYSAKECTQFCETLSQCEKIINNLFKNGSEKIIIEDYVEGKNIQIYTLSDGYKFQILGISAKYQDSVTYFEPEFLDEEIISNIIENIISPTIDSLAQQGDEYIGVLGFDVILKNDGTFVLIGYNAFFDDLNVDFYTQGFEVDWLKIFESTVVGDVFSKYEINPKNDYMVSLRQDTDICFVHAKTKHNLELYIKELYDNDEYIEAQRLWQF